MGLVDYSSESDSSGPEAEAPTKPTPKSKIGGGGGGASSKKVPSVVDKSKAGKIIVNLAGNAANNPSDEPPAKRARTTGGGGGGRFSGFNAFLPAPKNTAAKPTAGGSRGVGLRTSAAPGFSRDAADVPSITNVDATGDGDEEGDAGRTTTTKKSETGVRGQAHRQAAHVPPAVRRQGQTEEEDDNDDNVHRNGEAWPLRGCQIHRDPSARSFHGSARAVQQEKDFALFHPFR
ncbi:hypothetical protein BBAD15_g5983 [Beauveria bassiana D1-5]|uniref:Uncharacterized protein n=1 Tax=Beauveria bassiana D1-5 TaxID=1245745 RepID=A0A0A2W6Y6_BEABA|nr:hypothetical protein BBAD15_g5983 [Beauveria bassiana D1-5]